MGERMIHETRIAVELILRKLAEGASEPLQDYPHLPPAHIRAAIACAAWNYKGEMVCGTSGVI